MQVKFIQSKTDEAKYICFLAKAIAEGHYQKAGFSVLPNPTNDSIYFPNLYYSKEFWHEIKKAKSLDLDKPFPKNAIAEALQKMPDVVTDFDKSSWSKIEKIFIKNMINFLQSEKIIKNTNVKILLTKYGTHGSFITRKKGHKYTIYATYRTDLPIGMLIKTLLLAFYKLIKRQSSETGSARFLERQVNIEFLMTNTIFSKFFPDYNKFKYTAKNLDKSQEYLKKLGFSSKGNDLPIFEIIKILTPKEKKVFMQLLRNKGNVVSFSDFENLPSLYALSKIIENLRRKIRNLGVNKEVIKTKRGGGYSLEEC